YVCSAFDVEYHHAVFGNIRHVLSEQASKVFKFEEQEELHNNIIDKGLLKLCQANIKRAQAMAQQYPDVEVETQILSGKAFQVVLPWREEVKPTLLILARHGSHRIEGTDIGSQADNLVRLADTNILLIGTTDVHPEEIPWIEEDGHTGLEWAPEAEVRILRVPPFALGIARRAVEEYVLENYGGAAAPKAPLGTGAPEPPLGTGAARPGAGPSDLGTATPAAPLERAVHRNGASTTSSAGAAGAVPSEAVPNEVVPRPGGPVPSEAVPSGRAAAAALPTVTNERLDEAIRKLLPTHMQLIMGIGTAEELALAEVKAEEAMKRTVVQGHDADPEPAEPIWEAKCPFTGHTQLRPRTAKDPIVWTEEAYERLRLVPLI